MNGSVMVTHGGSNNDGVPVVEAKRNTKQAQVGVGVFVEFEGKICLGKRKGAHGEGEWSLPGGHLEFFESWEECSKREVEEETGLLIGPPELVTCTNNHFFEDHLHYVTVFMWARCIGGLTTTGAMLKEPDKCEGWQWFGPAELANFEEPMFGPLKTFFVQVASGELYNGFNHLHQFMLPKVKQ